MRRSDGRCCWRVVLDLEGRTATASGNHVRVVDLEAGALQTFDVVDLGAEDELHADLVDEHRDAIDLEDVVVILGAVEGKRVLKARAATTPNGHPKRLALGVLLRAEKLGDLADRLISQGDRCLRSVASRVGHFTKCSEPPVGQWVSLSLSPPSAPQ